MNTNAVVHFEIPADDIKRAKKFYEEIFGWRIEKFQMPANEPADEYWAVYATKTGKDGMAKTPGAINGGMMKRRARGQPFMNYIHVEA